MSCEPSVLPLSATMTSPTIPCSSIARWALSMHVASVSASFRHGMTTDSSITIGSVSSAARATSPSASASVNVVALPSITPGSLGSVGRRKTPGWP